VQTPALPISEPEIQHSTCGKSRLNENQASDAAAINVVVVHSNSPIFQQDVVD
jgi:hypothetical protein